MSSYVQTYVERDVAELLGIQKRREFEIFLKLCALRTGQLINYDEIARDSGISPATAKDWISVLEDSFLIRIVEPYHTNRSKRIIKTPKLYFIDSGICAYLAGWRDSEQLRLSPWSGPFFETVIFGELLRHFAHRGKECQIYFWRTKDGAEVDFLVRTDSGVTPVEVKLGIPKKSDLIPLENLPIDNLTEGALVSLAATSSLGHSAHPGWRYQSLAMDWLK